MRRSKHSLSNYQLLTCNMGELVPVGCFPVLPGDSIQQATSLLVRASPLIAPVMHPVHIRVHHWYVPLRLVWSAFEDFITGGPDGLDATVPPYMVISNNASYGKGTLLDYLGVPPIAGASTPQISVLPVRAYSLIWTEFYRDQDLQTPLTIETHSGNDTTTPYSLQNVAWEKDYFTTARPWTQKGPAVSLPLGTTAPVVPSGDSVKVRSTAGGAARDLQLAAGPAVSYTGGAVATNLWFDTVTGLEVDLTGATSATINELREALALQRYEEARARYGSRYTEYLRFLGVRSSDARLARPEYLGGGKTTLQFSEVLQTGATTSGTPITGVGGMAGHGIGAVRSNRYRRFFEEHGFVMSLMSVLPKTMYTSGLPRFFSLTTKEDYWQKELEHIGQQEIINKEVRLEHATPDGVFGYQDRYDHLRRVESGVHGDFRDTLNTWHMGRIFATDPALNSTFVGANPTTRVYQSTTADQLYVMANHSIQARRLVAAEGTSSIF